MKDVPPEVAAERPDLYLLCLFMLAVLTIVVLLVRHVFKRQKEQADEAAKERTADRQERKETREFIATLGESCHEANSVCIDRCEKMEERSSMALQRAAEAMLLHREAVKSCDRCGNYKPKEVA